MQPLSIGRDGEALVVSLHGEIDFLNAAPISEAIGLALTRERPLWLRVDLSEVTFLDSSGIGVLVSAMRAAEDASAAFRVDHPNAGVRDQLDRAGLIEVFGLTAHKVDKPVEQPGRVAGSSAPPPQDVGR